MAEYLKRCSGHPGRRNRGRLRRNSISVAAAFPRSTSHSRSRQPRRIVRGRQHDRQIRRAAGSPARKSGKPCHRRYCRRGSPTSQRICAFLFRLLIPGICEAPRRTKPPGYVPSTRVRGVSQHAQGLSHPAEPGGRRQQGTGDPPRAAGKQDGKPADLVEQAVQETLTYQGFR